MVAKVERTWPVELELADDGVSVEFIDTSEKNNLRTASAFDIGEETSLLHESERFLRLKLWLILLITEKRIIPARVEITSRHTPEKQTQLHVHARLHRASSD